MKKKKLYILSDGRIFYKNVIPFYKKNLISLSINDNFSNLIFKDGISNLKINKIKINF